MLRAGQWLAEPVTTNLNGHRHGAMDIDSTTNDDEDVRSSNSSGNFQFIPLSSYHDQAISMSINYVK